MMQKLSCLTVAVISVIVTIVFFSYFQPVVKKEKKPVEKFVEKEIGGEKNGGTRKVALQKNVRSISYLRWENINVWTHLHPIGSSNDEHQ